MHFLSIADPGVWLLAGVSVGVVFAILILLVLILGIFTAVAKATKAKVVVAKETRAEKKEVKAFERASQEDKAAIVAALHLYFTERENRENRVLTIVPTPNSTWGARLNPRL